MLSLNFVLTVLEEIAPLKLAESWDNVGLLLGSKDKPVKHIMTCLTITRDVVEEAIREKADLIVSHHPMMFKPVQRITSSSEEGNLLLQLAQHQVAVYSPHTAYDNATGGINEQLAQALELVNLKPLVPLKPETSYKIVVFVPEKDLEAVSQSAFNAGAGHIGNYSHCSFRSSGTGTFWGNEESNPTLGHAGRLESAAEYRLEIICPALKLSAVLSAITQAHSYEMPAIDVYPLHSTGTSKLGAGRIGELRQPISAQTLADCVAAKLGIAVALTGHRNHAKIQKIAIVCGAGGSLLDAAISGKADAFLTGEMRFHDELKAQAAGITVVVAGHYATERPGVEALAKMLQIRLPDCHIWCSRAEHNPAKFVPAATKLS
ncbi:MAG: Nif3-like dinuclear metal center hexameric protein [Planctomycetia bacterium]|nr:Nif3-like dinuclear metal center hexameric protein [Planctomycetia bacterium]